MKLLSVDVGIKNLSFCLFDYDERINIKDIKDIKDINDKIRILKWDNIDLSEKISLKCCELDKNGLICDKPATLCITDKSFCLKCSKRQPYLRLAPELKPAFINKQKMLTLLEIAKKYKIDYDAVNVCKKPEIIALINQFVLQNCFTDVCKSNATKIDLVTIGRNLQHKFDELFYPSLNDLKEIEPLEIDTIIIENQIGPIANKMKTIQGMLAQYFIMKNNNINIEFISASNKLKNFTPINAETGKPEKLDYKQRKQLGVKTSLNIVDTDTRFSEWSTFLHNHKKKDDLSDCFLQGIWYGGTTLLFQCPMTPPSRGSLKPLK
jgi:hypothetical protein